MEHTAYPLDGDLAGRRRPDGFGDRSSEWMLSIDSTWENAVDDDGNIEPSVDLRSIG